MVAPSAFWAGVGYNTEDVAVEAHGLVEVPDGYADVGEPGLGGDFRWQHTTTF